MSAEKEALKNWLRERGRIAVALSGGLDSSLLLAASVDILGAQNVLALTAITPYMMRREIDDAFALAKELGVRLLKIESGTPGFLQNNPSERCYLCKREIFSELKRMAASENFENFADGTNADDVSDYRPGMRALRELGVLSPLLECGMGKREIRETAASYGLKVADKPAYACLLTRLEHGAEVSSEILRRIDAAEIFLNSLGFKQVRVRVHGDAARVEVAESDMQKLFDMRAEISSRLKSLGFKHVSADLSGYSMGAMNKNSFDKKP